MSKNGNTAKMMDFQFPQPKEKQTIGQIIYNSKQGTYLGRTPRSWGKILVFYCIYYTVLAGLFTICLQGLYSTLSTSEPKWKLGESLIGTNPGLGFRPLNEDTERGSLIHFNTKKPAEGESWQALLDKFLIPYNGTGRREKFCSFNQTHNVNQVCAVDIETFGPCSPKEGYSYRKGRPCVFLKLNKIYNWMPDFYNDPTDLPADMPQSLKTHIANTTAEERNQIWISCDGQTDDDKANVGEMKFYPSQGFPEYYYPYLNQPDYLSPLIAVQFETPPIHQLVNVECRAWAKNIKYNGSNKDRKGSVSFQLMID